MKRVVLVFSFLMVIGIAMAAPAPSKNVTKAYYTSPIREFRGAAFYQWKKHETVKVAKASPEDTNKKPVVMPESTSASKPTASNRTN